MNPIIIDRIDIQAESSMKFKKGNEKNYKNGSKARRTSAYWQTETARQRRKQGKTRYDTHRREEQPDAEDLWMEDLHFANFLGLSKSKWGNGNYLMTYNGGGYSDEFNIDNPVNINLCDLYIRPLSSQDPYIIAEESFHLLSEMRRRDVDADDDHYYKEQEEEEQEQEEANFAEMFAYMREQIELAKRRMQAVYF